MTWELVISYDEGRTWQTIKCGTSSKSCKTKAKERYTNDNSCCDNYFHQYRIYALDGEQLRYVSQHNTRWRLKWNYGNLKPRTQQDGIYQASKESE